MKGISIEHCRYLRRNQTEAEKKIWSKLRNRRLCGAKFRRRYTIGRYILDFYCPKHKLAIEIDGGQHYEDKGLANDSVRSMELESTGIKMLRFSNLEVLKNIEGVLEVIYPLLSPLPERERI